MDWENGEGEVILSDDFNGQHWLYKADIVKDWIRDLTRIHDHILTVEAVKWHEEKQARAETLKGGS